jgi:Rod binding domain-containing protein
VTTPISGLPGIAPAAAALPAEVREAGPAAQQEYRTALAFERVLLAQLTESLQSTASGSDDEQGGAGGAYREMLPGAMADALVAGGGTGLASDLYRALRTQTP